MPRFACARCQPGVVSELAEHPEDIYCAMVLALRGRWLETRLKAGTPVTLMLLSVSRFDMINAAFGRETGDAKLEGSALNNLGLVHDELGGRGVLAAAVERAAEVVDDDLRAAACEFERIFLAEPAACTGDDGNLVLEADGHGCSPVLGMCGALYACVNQYAARCVALSRLACNSRTDRVRCRRVRRWGPRQPARESAPQTMLMHIASCSSLGCQTALTSLIKAGRHIQQRPPQ